MYAEKLQARRNPEQMVCGTITRTDGFALNLSRVRVADMNGRDPGYFYIDETVEPEKEYGAVCHEVLRTGRNMCFHVVRVTDNNLGMESRGITDQKLRWIRNCSAPG